MAEEPSIAVLVERIGNVQKSVDDIKKEMATKGDQTNTDKAIVTLTAALASERTERLAAVKEVAARLQLVEDRMEQRKYGVGIAIVLAVIGSLLGVFIR